MAGESQLTPVNRFCYLGSYLSNTISVDNDIESRLAKAGDAFGKLQPGLWGEHSVALLTKIAVYQAVVLSTLLYGCESWVLYRRSVRRLDEFHMRCLRKIAGIKWQDRVPNTEVLCVCGISGIEAFLVAAQLCWVGHVVRMEDDRIPKQVFFGQLSSGKRPQCGPVRRYKDCLPILLSISVFFFLLFLFSTVSFPRCRLILLMEVFDLIQNSISFHVV